MWKQCSELPSIGRRVWDYGHHPSAKECTHALTNAAINRVPEDPRAGGTRRRAGLLLRTIEQIFGVPELLILYRE
jgi:hypothetical protein